MGRLESFAVTREAVASVAFFQYHDAQIPKSSPRHSLGTLHIPPCPIRLNPFATPSHLPNRTLLDTMPDPQLPKPPLTHRPRSTNPQTRQNRRRRHKKPDAAGEASHRRRAHRRHHGTHERIPRVPHDAPENEDANVPQGTQQSAGAPSGWEARVRCCLRVPEVGEIALGGG